MKRTKILVFLIYALIICAGLSAEVRAQTDFWEPVGNLDNEVIFRLAQTGSGAIFAGSDSGVYRSDNLGKNWMKLTGGIPEERIYDLGVNSSDDILAAARSGFYFSNDLGHTWEKRVAGLNQTWVRSMAITSEDQIFIGAVDSALGYPGRIYYSEDNGLSWIGINDGLFGQNTYAIEFLVDSRDSVFLLAAADIIQSNFLYEYNQSEQKWSEVFRYPPNIEISVLAANQADTLFGGASDGMLKSSDYGNSWQSADLYPRSVEAIVPLNDTSLYAGTAYFGVFYSEDNGEFWSARSTGLLNSTVLSMIRHSGSGYLFAGTDGGGIYRSVDPVTAIDAGQVPQTVTGKFRLYQNYPNPFNPVTRITYEVPRRSHIQLTVYDLLGNRVRTLVNEEKRPGQYTVNFDGTGLAGGFYFYTLVSGDVRQTRKLLLLK